MADTTALDAIPDEIVITLRKPIEHNGETISELTLREPTAGEMEEWDKLSGIAADRKAIAIMAGLPEGFVRKLPARDFNKAARFIASFLA